VTRQLVDLHGGTVKAHSEERGRGTRLEVRLPLAREATTTTTGATAMQGGGAAARAGDGGGGASLRVLVVDDNEDAATLMAEALALHGYATRAAFNGAEALEAAAELAPDVVLLDIGLPVMDGYEVARRLRQDGRCAAARLIAITGYGQETDRRRAVVAGFDEHLTKPVSVSQLVATIARLAPKRCDDLAAQNGVRSAP
jgi:CheY-like chemotaxis protein